MLASARRPPPASSSWGRWSPQCGSPSAASTSASGAPRHERAAASCPAHRGATGLFPARCSDTLLHRVSLLLGRRVLAEERQRAPRGTSHSLGRALAELRLGVPQSAFTTNHRELAGGARAGDRAPPAAGGPGR